MKRIFLAKFISVFIIAFGVFVFSTKTSIAADCRTLRGTVRDAVTSDPIVGAVIHMLLSHDPSATVESVSGGSYSHVSAATFTITSVTTTASGYYSSTTTGIGVSGDVCTADFSLIPSDACSSLAGVITDATPPNTGIGGAEIRIDGNATGVTTNGSGLYTYRPSDGRPFTVTTVSASAAGYNAGGIGGTSIVRSENAGYVSCGANFSLALASGASCDCVYGSVVKAGTSDPVDQVTVELRDSAGLTGRTNTVSDGIIEFPSGCRTAADPNRNISVALVRAVKSGFTDATATIDRIPVGTVDFCNVGTIQMVAGAAAPPAAGPGFGTPLAPTTFTGKVQTAAIGLGAVLALIRIFLGAYKLMQGGDNPQELEEGRDMITSSIIGLLVILFAVTLLTIIGRNVLGVITTPVP